ncbi:MAG TPA: hypothetical protein PK252_00610 [Bacteroidales bacterium]|nr:hypothetical protein [Bacteroidales bacterium]
MAKFKLFITCVLCFLITHFSFSQSPTSDIFGIVTSKAGNEGTIKILQSNQIKTLVNAYVQSKQSDGLIVGYRIRIFSNSGQLARGKAASERSRFISLYPDINTYQEYEAPNFKIYVGDFRNKLEAFKAYQKISKDFKSAFIISTRINLPKL